MTVTHELSHDGGVLKIAHKNSTADKASYSYLKSWLRSDTSLRNIPDNLVCVRNRGIFLCRGSKILKFIDRCEIKSVMVNQFMKNSSIFVEFPVMLEIRHRIGRKNSVPKKSAMLKKGPETASLDFGSRIFLFEDESAGHESDLTEISQVMQRFFDLWNNIKYNTILVVSSTSSKCPCESKP